MVYLFLSDNALENDTRNIINVFYPLAHIKVIRCQGQYTSLKSLLDTGEFAIHVQHKKLKPDAVQITTRLCDNRRVWTEGETVYGLPEGYIKDKAFKYGLKRCVLKLLTRYTGYRPPWGILTGIRPVKLVNQMRAQGVSAAEIWQYLTDELMLSNSKGSLLMEVSDIQQDVLASIARDGVNIYIGIPFCTSRCIYCSFVSQVMGTRNSNLEEYLNCLLEEIRCTGRMLGHAGIRPLNIYIGGGTPTSLDINQLRELLDCIRQSFSFEGVEEYNIEAGRPDTIDKDKLTLLYGYGINRLCINPQTFNEKTLKLIGRKHTARDIIDKYYIARKIGFKNINMDIIVGLPGEDDTMVANTLGFLDDLKPDSVTVHALAIKKGSHLKEKAVKSRNTLRHNYICNTAMVYDSLRKMDMIPYYLYRQKYMHGNEENIGFCRKGKEGLYNITTMEDSHSIIALGAGAISKAVLNNNRIERISNPKDTGVYVNRIHQVIDNKREMLEMLTLKNQ
ncbi:MAG TPA: coproporphyrinogen dehydrogenase HemZ [Clostridiales bacterium]|mgnify:CR=1 FL=1|nr:coproporphyrinogen dehydrogenase HemZ [Clostridiales bacterium]